jgi:hypothetical protein
MPSVKTTMQKTLLRQENENNGGSHRRYRLGHYFKPPPSRQAYCHGPLWFGQTPITQ